MVFSGVVGATCGGFVIDYFKLFKEVMVVCFSLGLLCFIWFIEVSYRVHCLFFFVHFYCFF